MVRRWFLRGERPRMAKDVRYRSAYLFGAVCHRRRRSPGGMSAKLTGERDAGAALVLPRVSTQGMSLLLAEIAALLPTGTHAAVLMDNAGWHIAHAVEVPPTITLVSLPPYAPELNAIERVWQHLRDRYLSGRLFRNTRAIVDACCDAWNALTAEAGRIRSLTSYEWARPVRT